MANTTSIALSQPKKWPHRCGWVWARRKLADPDYQLGRGCLVDQLVGQFFAHVCGLGYLTKRAHVRQTLKSIRKYNHRKKLTDHFNCMRSYALGDESALLMASYPHERPDNPFPYFTEVMTGFEYTAAIGMLYEGQLKNGLQTMRDIRNRYDGAKRSPFDEAECGHHYARAMVAWAGVLALTGFNYSGVTKSIAFAARARDLFLVKWCCLGHGVHCPTPVGLSHCLGCFIWADQNQAL